MSIIVTCECGESFEAAAEAAGGRVRCPACGSERAVPEPKPEPTPELFFVGDEAGPSISGKAVASLTLGVLFFFACFSGVPAIILGREALGDIRRSGGRLRGRGLAIAGIVLGVFGCLVTVALFLPMVRSAREAARRSQCVNNLKQIGLAIHNYHDSYGRLPTAAITGKDGRPLLSWRVAILPYLESSLLYSQFHLDEPWDSPHNLSLLKPVPQCYTCPSDPDQKPGMTGYLAVVGPRTAFTPDFTPVRLEDITDGTGETLLVGESRHLVPWTKPEDLPFGANLPLNGLGSHHGYHNNGFNTLLADGSVRFLKRSIDPATLKAILTRNGNETVSADSY